MNLDSSFKVSRICRYRLYEKKKLKLFLLKNGFMCTFRTLIVFFKLSKQISSYLLIQHFHLNMKINITIYLYFVLSLHEYIIFCTGTPLVHIILARPAFSAHYFDPARPPKVATCTNSSTKTTGSRRRDYSYGGPIHRRTGTLL